MNGFFCIYNGEKRIDRANHYLFGRLQRANIKQGKRYYYYPGVLENVGFYKLSNGCYFVLEKIDSGGYIFLIEGKLKISKEDFTTGKKMWEEKVSALGAEVINFA